MTLNRPQRRNSLTIELLNELVASIKVASDQADERVLILRGSGAAFCTGLDLKEAADRRGLVAGLVMTFLRRQAGERNMRELVLGGELIDAERARGIGLVNRVVAPDQLMIESQKFADSVLQGAPNAIVQTKRLIEELWSTSVKEDVDLALKHHMRARESAEAREGIAAFNEKRKPNWSK
ncbi:MAG: hypothetical protein DMF18_04430 [Verrucomicrobia bacterium]|nr:MAG: hypothetical protein DMF18_04430 [Verrucomicrobiota bacterium]